MVANLLQPHIPVISYQIKLWIISRAFIDVICQRIMREQASPGHKTYCQSIVELFLRLKIIPKHLQWFCKPWKLKVGTSTTSLKKNKSTVIVYKIVSLSKDTAQKLYIL